MKRKFTFVKMLLLTAIFVFGSTNTWSDEGDIMYSADFTSSPAFGYTLNKELTLDEKAWTMSVGQFNGGVLYWGVNSSSSNTAMGVLAGTGSNNPNKAGFWNDVITAWNATDEKATAGGHAYALMFDNSMSNVGEVTLSWAGGNGSSQVFLFGDTGDGFVLLSTTDYATSGAAVAGSVGYSFSTGTDVSRFAIVARPGTTTGVTINKTLRLTSFVVKEGSSSQPTVSTPTISPDSELIYDKPVEVAIQTTTTDAEIYYTLDGTDPDNTKTKYTVPFLLNSTTTVKAIAYKEGLEASKIVTATYQVEISTDPIIIVDSPVSIDLETTVENLVTSTIIVKAENLTEDITLTIDGEHSRFFNLSHSSISHLDGKVEDTEVAVSYNPMEVGFHSASLTLSSSGFTIDPIVLSGASSFGIITFAPATDIKDSEFTANWDALPGATEYELEVYTKEGNSVYKTANLVATDLIISEYLEGSGNNKAIEIYNGTGASVDLSSYSLKKQTNGAGAYKDELKLSGILENSKTYVIAHSKSNAQILAVANLKNDGTINFNGNDAIGLFKVDIQIDEVGVFGEVPDWGKDVTLARKSSVLQPKLPYDATEWDVFSTDYATGLGSHTMDIDVETIIHIEGSPFTVTETTKRLSGLNVNTTYYYAVAGKAGNLKSEKSEEFSITTLAGLGMNFEESESIRIFVQDGNIEVVADNTVDIIEVYNANGTKIVNQPAKVGRNTIYVEKGNVYIVKVGGKVAKAVII